MKCLWAFLAGSIEWRAGKIALAPRNTRVRNQQGWPGIIMGNEKTRDLHMVERGSLRMGD